MSIILFVSPPIIEVDLQGKAQPAVFDRLISVAQQVPMVVVQRLASRVRCVMLVDDVNLSPGDDVVNDSEPAPVAVFSESVLMAAVDGLVSNNDDVFCETGILALDVLCPLPRRGSVCIIGGEGVGRMTMVEELHARLNGKSEALSVVFPIVQHDAHLVPLAMADWQDFPADDGSGISSLWFPYDRAADPVQAKQMSLSTSIVTLAPQLAKRGILPAVDPLSSTSLLLRPEVVGSRHCAIVDAIKTLAAQSKARRDDLGICDADESNDKLIKIWQRVEDMIAQPFYCRESVDGRKGIYVPLESALDTLELVLDEVASLTVL